MKIHTSAGEMTFTQFADNPDLVYGKGSPEAIQALYDGLVMSDALPYEDPPRDLENWGHRSCSLSKEQLAIWIQFEILNYLTYTELPEDMQ